MEAMYQKALEKMVPAYRRWDRASDKYYDVRRSSPDNRAKIERASVREEQAYEILHAQTRLIGELFGKDEDKVWSDVENMYFTAMGE